MEKILSVLHVYFYAKKEPRKKDGKFPILGRLVNDGKRAQFSTQVFMTEEMLPFISAHKWRKKKTEEMFALERVRDVMWMLYIDRGKAGLDIDLDSMVSEFKQIQKEQPDWWEAMV